jgi:hypothetical protein
VGLQGVLERSDEIRGDFGHGKREDGRGGATVLGVLPEVEQDQFHANQARGAIAPVKFALHGNRGAVGELGSDHLVGLGEKQHLHAGFQVLED